MLARREEGREEDQVPRRLHTLKHAAMRPVSVHLGEGQEAEHRGEQRADPASKRVDSWAKLNKSMCKN